MVDMKTERSALLRCLTMLLMILIIGLIPPSRVAGEETALFQGTVLDFETKAPIANATVVVWENQILRGKSFTDAFGFFILQVPKGNNYRIYTYFDSANTQGWDYLPVIKEVSQLTGDMNFTLELTPGASVIIDEDIQFIDSTKSSTTYTYEICNPENGAILEIDGYKPKYGTPESAHTHFIGINTSHLVVPAEIPFDIRVNASAVVESKMAVRSFNIEEPDHFRLSKGDLIRLDVRKYSLQYNLALVESKINAVWMNIEEMDQLDFYLILEKQRFTTITETFDRAKLNLSQDAYIDSFNDLRRAYIDITDLNISLIGMYNDASTSVYILIFFLAFASTAVSFLAFNKPSHKVIASGILTVLMHALLHETYPSISFFPTVAFIEFSAIAWCVALFITAILPRFLSGGAVKGETPLRNILVPIFSIAKRSLTRRRLRFALTLSSVTILVMSFVALTSFTTGYGLVVNRISNQPFPMNAILVRAPKTELYPTFAPVELEAVEWLQKCSEVETMAPKAENLPIVQQLTTLSGSPIYGLIGIQPSAEAKILGLDKIVLEGDYLKDDEENAILISSDLKRKLSVDVNATLPLGLEAVRIVGVYEYEKLRLLNDLDGNSLIPNKLVNVNPPGEPTNLEATPVEADELIICGLEGTESMPGVKLSRINVILREGESANDFAERMALEKNYDVWASSGEGLYLARLGSYFQGKGVLLAVPWIIVVLNVVITMLNALYERRKEISLLSSVGLNPSHIAGIFIAEAVAIGLIGGGIGYLLGLNMYKMMTLLHITLEVRQKTSALWSFGAVAIAMTAVIIGAASALKGSVAITPSLRRRWRIEDNEDPEETTEMSLPLRIRNDEIEEFVDYVIKALRSYENDPTYRTTRIKTWNEDAEKKSPRSITFNYRTVDLKRLFSKNRLIIEKNKGEEVYTVKMISQGDSSDIYETGNLIRMIILRWSTRK